jgi:hypothetical protein
MQIKSRWTMRGHFKHLNLKKILMVSWRFNLMLVYLSNQGFEHLQLSHECNSQSGSALGSHRALSLAFSPICESVFRCTPKHTLGLMGPCTSHLVTNPMLKVATWWHVTLEDFRKSWHVIRRFNETMTSGTSYIV